VLYVLDLYVEHTSSQISLVGSDIQDMWFEQSDGSTRVGWIEDDGEISDGDIKRFHS
jgi:hypothetical protein